MQDSAGDESGFEPVNPWTFAAIPKCRGTPDLGCSEEGNFI